MSETNLPAKAPELSPVIARVAEVMKDMPAILQRNEKTAARAELEVNALLAKCDAAAKITKELDDELAETIIKVRDRDLKMKDNRNPYTQMMTEVAKMFTSAEGRLAPLLAKMQEKRNLRLRQVKEENERIAKEQKARQDKATEAANIEAFVFSEIGKKLNAKLAARKTLLTEGFNSITLENFQEKKAKLDTISNMFPEAKLAEILNYVLPTPIYHTMEEAQALETKIRKGFNFSLFYTQYQQECDELIRGFRDRLPSKLTELQEEKAMADRLAAIEEEKRLAKIESDRLAEEQRQAEKRRQDLERQAREETNKAKQLELKAKQEQLDRERMAREKEQERQRKEAEALQEQQREQELEQERLKEQQLERERADAEKIAEEQRKGDNIVSSAATLHQTSAMAVGLFASTQMANVIQATGETRDSVEITVLELPGWAEIFQNWFMSPEAAKLWADPDKFENMTFGRMKAYAEKQGWNKDPKKIIRIVSPFLKYEEVSSAVARKTRTKKNQ